jgi:uncharacterized RmlC-like cupin family protein
MAPEPRCRVVHTRERYEGKQAVSYLGGISKESVGATGICMHLVTIPAGSRGRAHLHEAHETAIYVLSGRAVVWSGEGLTDRTQIGTGDLLYIPAGEPHLPVNDGDEPVTVVLARTDPSDQESVVLLPELDHLPHLC